MRAARRVWISRMTTEDPPEPTLGTIALISEVIASTIRLIKGEMALARAETLQKVRLALRAIVFIVLATIFGMAAINMLAGAAVAGLIQRGWSPFAATLAVAGTLLALSLGAILYARSLIRTATELRLRALEGLRLDVETLKDKGTPDAEA
jgi:hypothetical protein